MNMRVGIAVVAAALFGFAATASAQNAAPQQTTPRGDAKAGAKIFKADGCWECHGSAAQGGALSGPRIADTALPFAAVLQQLRVPQNAMPPYEASVVSDAEVGDIYAFLKSLPAPQTAANIPLLSK